MRFIYKDSSIWNKTVLGNLCTPHARIGWQNLRSDEFLGKGDFYLITGTDFCNGRINFNTCHYISNERYNQDKKLWVKNNDILITKDGTIGKVAIVKAMDKKGTLNAGVFILNDLSKDIDNHYLYHYLSAPFLLKYVSDNSTGGTIKHLNLSVLINFEISFPNIIEQQKIADFLSLIDNRIDTQSKIIEDLDTLKNSIMDQLLMCDIFDEISIKDFINQGYARIIKASEMKKFSGEKLYLSTSSIDKNGIFKIECKVTYNDRPSRASMIPIKNSVWFAKMKDSIKVYKSENDDESKYILSTGFYGILCNEDVVNSDWMVEIFKSNYFNNQKDRFSEGSSMSGIKENQLEDIKVKLFKNKNLEKKYCQLFYILNKKLNVETDYLEKLKEQKKYLLLNMFI